ncbi:MAG TPA: DUF2079 domain-containing protein [Anaerolineae bacterium]|nr:DUF2079 domain-containing protein [Anaerolineae bacterium]
MNARRLRTLSPPALALLAGAVLALAWWDWTYPGWIEIWWHGGRVYRTFWLRLAWMVLAAAGLALALWWASSRARASTPADGRGASPRPYLPFLLALLAPLTLARYAFHPFGIQAGSSIWTYALVAITAAVLILALAQIRARLSAPRPAEGSPGRSAPESVPNRGKRRRKHSLVRRTLAGHRGSLLVVVVAAVAYLLVFAFLSVARYDGFRAHGLDLGTMDQAAWNTIHGRILERTPLYRHPADGSRYENRLLDAKLELVFLPLSALYVLWSDPRLLLLVQTAALAAGAIPLYLLGRERLASGGTSEWPAALLAVAYLVYLPLHYVNMADFHPSALMIPPLIASWRAMRLRRWPHYYLWLGLALCCRIDAAFIGLGLGAVILLTQTGARRHGVWTMLIAAAWLTLDLAVVVPAVRAAYGPGAGDLVSRRFEALGGGPLGILRTFVARPLFVLGTLVDLDKAQVLFDLLAPTGFLGLLAPWALAPALPVLVINFLSGSVWQQSVHAHYMAPAIPFVWIGAVEGLAWLSCRTRSAEPRLVVAAFSRYARPSVLASFVLAYTALISWAFSPFPPGRAFRLADLHQPSQYEQDLRALLARVPAEATVCAQSDLHPHLSQRRDIALYPRCTLEPGLEAEYVVLDLDPTSTKSPVDHHTFYLLLHDWLAREDYGPVALEGSALLLRHGASRQDVPGLLQALEAYGAGLYRVAFVEGRLPPILCPDDYYRVPLVLRNVGTQNWQAQGTLPVRISYRWLDDQGQPLSGIASLRTDLPHRVAPGHTVRLRAALLTPPTAGTYTLEWEVLREGDAWFSTRGGETLRQNVQVR